MKGSFATFAIIGFGYGHRTSDFKILLIVHAREVASERLHREHNEIQVHSLKNSCWRRIQPNIPCTPCLSSNSTVHLNGAQHWLGVRKERNGTDKKIIGHSILVMERSETESCRIICTIFDYREISVGVLEKSIALFVSGHSEDNRTGLGVCNVYVMMENIGLVESWINLFTVDLKAQFAWQYLGFRANGEVMLINDDGDLILCDHKNLEAVIGLLMPSHIQKSLVSP